VLENKVIHRLLHINPLIMICITFTIATIFDTILTVAAFGDVGTTYAHLITRLILCTFISLSLLVFRLFKRLRLPAILGIHFAALMGFTALYVWLSDFFLELHPDAMFYMLRSILIVYIPIAMVCIILDIIAKKRRNNENNS